MTQQHENLLIEDLKAQKHAAYELLYKLYFPLIERFVCSNSGSTADAEDIFQETVLVLYQKIVEKEFVVTSSLKTFLYAIGRNLWLKRLRDNRLVLIRCEIGEAINVHETTEDHTNSDEEHQQLQGLLAKVTAHCRLILESLFLLNVSMHNLMSRMGWKNKHTADNQKYKCIKQARGKVLRN